MHSVPTTSQVRWIDALTAFRFLAAFSVFLVHLDYESYPILDRTFQRFFYNTSGVVFFFVLSGFILTYTYHTKLSSLNWSEIKKFYLMRFARLYPVHLLTFFLAVPVVYQAIPVELTREFSIAIANLTLTQSLNPGAAYFFSFDAPAWSLSDEVFFSAVLPFLLAIVAWVKGTSLRRILTLGIGILAADFTIVWLLRDIHIHYWLFYVSPYFRLFDFSFGAMLCLFYLRIKDVCIPRLFFTLLEIASLSGFAIAIYFFPSVGIPLNYAVYYLPFVSFIVLIFAFQRGRVSNIISNRMFVLLGQISFSFYMVHWLVIRYIAENGLFGITSCPACAAGSALATSIALGYASFRFFESPIRRALVRRVT